MPDKNLDQFKEQYKEMPDAPANLVYDLYKVADAQPMKGYDAFTFNPVDALKDSQDQDVKAVADQLAATETEEGRKAMTADAYRSMAQILAQKTLMGGGLPNLTKAAEGVSVGSATPADAPLAPGLYLVVVRGAGIQDYWQFNEATGTISTFGVTDNYQFNFSPELVAVPNRADGGAGFSATSDRADWQYNVAAILKPTWEQRFGSIKIQKTLANMDASQPASFLFQVDAWADAIDGESLVYSNVVPVTFTKAGQETVTVGDIPAGAHVRVTEVYSGAGYTVNGDGVVDIQSPVPADNLQAAEGEDPAADAPVATFENSYEDNGHHGGSIVNTFTYEQTGVDDQGNPTGGWNWSNGQQGEGEGE